MSTILVQLSNVPLGFRHRCCIESTLTMITNPDSELRNTKIKTVSDLKKKKKASVTCVSTEKPTEVHQNNRCNFRKHLSISSLYNSWKIKKRAPKTDDDYLSVYGIIRCKTRVNSTQLLWNCYILQDIDIMLSRFA